MATYGNYTATSASAEAVPANDYRDHLFIQHTNTTQIALGFGVAAEASKGVQLIKINDCVRLEGALARKAVYAIGNNGTLTYQEGFIDFKSGPHVA